MEKGTKRGREEVFVGIDRISTLPDDILIHILSFLNFKKAVQTCILSKRWSDVWASVHFLKVSQQQFRSDGNENQREYMDKFVHFVHGLAYNLRVSSLDTFECFFPNSDRQNHSVEFLGRAAALMRRVFVFYGNIPKCLDLPESAVSCASLQNLKLHSSACGKIIRPELINLPSLKVLELRCVELDDDFTHKLFLSFPALQGLVLRSCTLGTSKIASNILKMLNLDHCWQTKNMQISCPGLVSLSIKIVSPREGISLEIMEFLATADISIHNCSYDTSILRGLSNATTVKFFGSLQSMAQLKKDITYCKLFNNLKIVEFGGWDMTINFDLVACFLKNSPNLQKLYLQLGSHGHIQGHTRQEANRDVSSKREYVEFVKITGGRKAQDNKMVKILRRHIKNIGHLLIL
ncbi:F-box family protein [Rhynchospora pubera]|uniref:F-box family protein n=1 Tax=Rhynchospora pubera TaxID=906938 RepID=A0AAV8F0D5_9POAL|nr:F-box family protein [Rhynchospora pubera]